MTGLVAGIPAYEPDGRMIDTVKGVSEHGFDVVLVDDGSGSEYAELFKQASEYARVISYPINHG